MAKVAVEVSDRKQGAAVKSAIADGETRALAVILGTLVELEPAARVRTLRYLNERFAAPASEG